MDGWRPGICGSICEVIEMGWREGTWECIVKIKECLRSSMEINTV